MEKVQEIVVGFLEADGGDVHCSRYQGTYSSNRYTETKEVESCSSTFTDYHAEIYIYISKEGMHTLQFCRDELESKFMQEQKDSHIGRLGGDLIGLFQTNLLL